jgi:hypothetical protein
MPNKRLIWVIAVSGVVLSGAAIVTLRAAEQHPPTAPAHPAPSAPEESATITDDPTTAPDPSQSADNNVSFPNDI